MNTRSKCSNHDSGLSVTVYGGGGIVPSSRMTTRFGPSAPRCSQIDAEPGPPLKAKHTGRVSRVGVVEEVRRREHRRFGLAALVVDAAGRHRDEAATALYLSVRPSSVMRRFALARLGREQRVDLLAQLLLRVVVGGRRGWWWFGIGHGRRESQGRGANASSRFPGCPREATTEIQRRGLSLNDN